MATIIDVCEAVKVKIATDWDPVRPSCVQRIYVPDIDDPYKVLGRQVYVFPVAQSQTGTASRSKDENEYQIGVLAIENYRESSGAPPLAWCDERVNFCVGLWSTLGESRGEVFPYPLNEFRSNTAEIPVIFDPDELREKKLFWSYLQFSYRRHE